MIEQKAVSQQQWCSSTRELRISKSDHDNKNGASDTTLNVHSLWIEAFHVHRLAKIYRVGEAKNPGPAISDDSCRVCVYNPTGMHNKRLFFLKHLQSGIS